MAKRTMPSDGPYKAGDKAFVWNAQANPKSIASKAMKKEHWVRGTVISQERTNGECQYRYCCYACQSTKSET